MKHLSNPTSKFNRKKILKSFGMLLAITAISIGMPSKAKAAIGDDAVGVVENLFRLNGVAPVQRCGPDGFIIVDGFRNGLFVGSQVTGSLCTPGLSNLDLTNPKYHRSLANQLLIAMFPNETAMLEHLIQSAFPPLFGFTPVSFPPRQQQFDTTRFNMVLSYASGKDGSDNKNIDGLNATYLLDNGENAKSWNFYANAKVSGLDDNRSGRDRNSILYDVSAGIYYKLSSQTRLGISGSFKTGEVESDAQNSTLDGDYYGVELAFAHRFSSGIKLGLGAKYQHGSNDINISGQTGSFDADVFTLAAIISGDFQSNGLVITPSARFEHNYIRRDGFTDSVGIVVPNSNIETGLLSIGTSISKTIEHSGDLVSSFTPSVGVHGTYRYDDVEDQLLLNLERTSEIGVGVDLSGGIAMNLSNGASFNVNGTYGFYQDDIRNWTVNANLSFPIY